MPGFVSWAEAELVQLEYFAGAWQEALTGAREFLATVGPGYYMAAVARGIVAGILTGKGDRGEGLDESGHAVSFARGAKDPQMLFPALAAHARLLAIAGRIPEANDVADELLTVVADARFLPNQWVLHLTFALDELDRVADASRFLAGLTLTTKWRDASEAYAGGELVRAADILRAMGNRTDEAYVRLRAAERGEPGQAESALAFYRSVNATAYERRAAELLRGTA